MKFPFDNPTSENIKAWQDHVKTLPLAEMAEALAEAKTGLAKIKDDEERRTAIGMLALAALLSVVVYRLCAAGTLDVDDPVLNEIEEIGQRSDDATADRLMSIVVDMSQKTRALSRKDGDA